MFICTLSVIIWYNLHLFVCTSNVLTNSTSVSLFTDFQWFTVSDLARRSLYRAIIIVIVMCSEKEHYKDFRARYSRLLSMWHELKNAEKDTKIPAIELSVWKFLCLLAAIGTLSNSLVWRMAVNV